MLQDIDKALYYYKISSDLHAYGATADYIRLKNIYDKDFDLIGALEKMLEYSETPNKHSTLSFIGSYYLFLKRDLITALKYYRRVMDEDQNSSALKVCECCFYVCNIKTIFFFNNKYIYGSHKFLVLKQS